MGGGPLPPDAGDSFEADLMAMRQDAREWGAAAEQIAEAAAAVQRLSVGAYEFSFGAEETGLREAYQRMQAWAGGLLDGARTNLANMAVALAKAADTYEASDGAAARSFDRLDHEIKGS